MKKLAVATALGVPLVLVLAWWFSPVMPAPVAPDVAKDLPGKVVAVQDPITPGQISGWYFDKNDALTVKVVDARRDGYKDIYYAEVTSKAQNGAQLAGTVELYYITIAKRQHLIAVGSINLETTLPPAAKVEPKTEPKVEPKNEPAKLQPAQRPPGS